MPSRLYLRRLDQPPPTILDHLVDTFPHVDRETWIDRMERGLVTFEDGEPVMPASAYTHGRTVHYRREVPDEQVNPYPHHILYRDSNLIVADKPPFLPVTPGGSNVRESLLERLRSETGIESIAPLHRLDRETSGLVLFSIDPTTRPLYHELFATSAIDREYEALGSIAPDFEGEKWSLSNRIESGDPWFRMRIIEGEPNARTEIELIERRGGMGRFLLRPGSGKKHQLRLHMMAIGAPILHDPYYPELRREKTGRLEHPMALLATRLRFIDPASREEREFRTVRRVDSLP